jgi:DNA-binding NarL/FixJ family response regulator
MNAISTKCRILIVDDHPMVRERLAEVIKSEPDLLICGEAETRLQALQLVVQTHPDLVLLDLNLKDSQGTEVIKDIVAQKPRLRVLVISMHDESLFAERAIRAGACGYITKQEATKNVLVAIRKVLGGELYFSETLAKKLLANLAGGIQGPAVPSVDLLSDRELQVLRLLGLGRSTRQAAKDLHLEFSTVETYRTRIKDKLNLNDANDLVQYAINWVRSSGQV